MPGRKACCAGNEPGLAELAARVSWERNMAATMASGPQPPVIGNQSAVGNVPFSARDQQPDNLFARLPQGVVTTSVDQVFQWARKSSLWPMTFGLACCAI